MASEGLPQIETARNGSPTLVLNGRYLHSRHNPEREAQRAMSDLVRREPPAVVFLGLGLGYQAAFLMEHTEVTSVIAFEPSGDILRLAREHGPLTSLLDSGRVRVVATPAELTSVLPQTAADGFVTVELPGRSREDELFRGARMALAAFSDRLDINRNTLQRFGRLWVRNLCRNLPRLVDGRGVGELRGSFDGVPTLLLAAGPTLDQVLPILPELAKRLLVVAVDTAVGPALRAGVEPDFAVVVDPQYWNARHLDRLAPSASILVSEASAHPRVFRPFEGPVFFCSSVFPLGRAFESAAGSFGSLGAGGSVSTTAWDLARSLGSDRIYAAGLDLGFPAGRTHCRSSFFEHLALVRGTRVRPAEQVVFRYTWSANPTRVAANDGTSLLSDRRMEVYRSWFASQLALPDAPPTSAATRGGARVDGMGFADIADLLDLPSRRDDVNTRIAAIRSTRSVPRAERRIKLLRKAEELGEATSDLARVARRACDAVERIRRDHDAGGRIDFSPLLPIDREMGAHAGAAIGSFLIQDAIGRIRAGFGSADLGEQIEASAQMYGGLAKAAEFHAEQLALAARALYAPD